METDPATARTNRRRPPGHRSPGGRRRARRRRRSPRRGRRKRRGPPARRTEPIRRRQLRSDVGRRPPDPALGATTSAGPRLVRALGLLVGVEPPHVLARLLGTLPLAGRRPRLLVTVGVFWLLCYAGWQAGLLDGEAGLWLAAGVVIGALFAVGLETTPTEGGAPPQRRQRPPGRYRRRR